MEQRRAHSRAWDTGAGLVPEGLEVPGEHDGQRAFLLVPDPCHGPALPVSVVQDLPPHLVSFQARVIRVPRVFDEEAALGERQRVEEAEAVELGNGGVHEDGAVEAVLLLQLEGQPHELLEAQDEVPAAGIAPAVDDRARLDPAPVGEPHRLGGHVGHLDPQPQPSAQGLADDLAEPPRGRGVVPGGQATGQRREADQMLVPGVGHEGGDPAVLLVGQVSFVEGPGVLPSQMLSPLEDQEAHLGSEGEQPPGDQAVGQPASHEHHVGSRGASPLRPEAARGVGEVVFGTAGERHRRRGDHIIPDWSKPVHKLDVTELGP